MLKMVTKWVDWCYAFEIRSQNNLPVYADEYNIERIKKNDFSLVLLIIQYRSKLPVLSDHILETILSE